MFAFSRLLPVSAILAVLLLMPPVVLAQDGGIDSPGMGEGRGPGAIAGGQMLQGTVTAAAPTSLTVKTEAGDLYQVVVSDNTHIMKNRAPIKLADIRAGDGVGAMGLLDAPTKTLHAAFLMVIDAEQVRKAREGLGKVYIAGRVTAIDDVTLTILRPDNVSQVIQVDEGTSFRRRGGGRRNGLNSTSGSPSPSATEMPSGESITLADVNVGDTVMGQGAVKEGIFTPTLLSVSNGVRQRRFGAPGATAGPQPATSPLTATPSGSAPK